MNHITEQLVETIAQRVHAHQLNALANASNKDDIPDHAFRTWDELSPVDKFNRSQYVLNDLNFIVPALIETGWLPPAKHDAIRETVRDRSLNELHKSLMKSLREHPEQGGHNTQEGLNGYSEDAEHGTISIASRIKTILDGDTRG